MRILVFWDVYWRIWRKALAKELPILKNKYNPDFVIVNIENATWGRGPIEDHAIELEKIWIDVMTSWDHIFDNESKIKDYLDKTDSKLIRPINFYESSEYKISWKWYKIVQKDWKKLLVINLMSETFMKFNVYNPFLKIEEFLKNIWEDFDAIIVDFHKEVSSEAYWLWYLMNGRLSFIYGTHTHMQTNDENILENWTWIISDVWMVWPFPSVIGADFESLKKRFLTWMSKWKIEQSLNNNYVVNWIYVEIENKKTIKLEKIRIRNILV